MGCIVSKLFWDFYICLYLQCPLVTLTLGEISGPKKSHAAALAWSTYSKVDYGILYSTTFHAAGVIFFSGHANCSVRDDFQWIG